MKKLLPLCFAFLLAGCMHYATPHGQDIALKNIEKLPVKVGLYIPESISKDSIEVDFGDYWNWIHLFILRSGSSIATAINKSIAASVNEVTLLDSTSYQDQTGKDSLAFIISPEVIRRNSTIWPNAWNLFKNYDISTFEAKIRLNLTDKNHQTIDSIFIHTIGLNGRVIDSVAAIDSIIADAADSAISDIQDQIIFNITRNTRLRSYLGLTKPVIEIASATPVNHGLFGFESVFTLDTLTNTLYPIPQPRRWSMVDDLSVDFYDRTYIGIDIDLLLQSHFSFRFGILLYDYFQQRDSYYSFSESRFIDPSGGDFLVNWAIKAQTTYLFFGPKHFLELGGGINAVIGKIHIPSLQRFDPYPVIGYRFQSVLGGICYGIYYTPEFDQFGRRDRISMTVGFSL